MADYHYRRHRDGDDSDSEVSAGYYRNGERWRDNRGPHVGNTLNDLPRDSRTDDDHRQHDHSVERHDRCGQGRLLIEARSMTLVKHFCGEG